MERTIEVGVGVAVDADDAFRHLSVVLAAWRSAGRRRLTVDLGSSFQVAHEVAIDVTPVPGQRRFCISWTPVGHARLVPSFWGHLVVDDDAGSTRLVIEGRYRPPFGAVGAVGDGVAGRHLARRTVTAFLDEVGAEVRRHAATVPTMYHPPLWAEPLRDR